MGVFTRIISLFYRYRNIVLYGIIGSFAALIDFLIFRILTSINGFYYVFANIVSVSVGITISFSLNKRFNFRVFDKVLKRFVVFALIGLSGLLISSVIIFVLVDLFDLNKTLAKAMTIILLALVQFLLNKSITFN